MKTRPSRSEGFSIRKLFNLITGRSVRSNQKPRRRNAQLGMETLEGRAVMSGLSAIGVDAPAVAQPQALSRVGVLALQAPVSPRTPSSAAPSPIANFAARDPDDQISEAADVGAMTTSRTTSGVVSGTTDVDMFKVSVSAGQRVAFDVDVTGAFDSVIRLFDSSGAELAINDDASAPGEGFSRESYLEYTFGTRGTYYFGISGYQNSAYDPRTGSGDSAGSTGSYSVTVKPQSTQPSDPPVSRFDVEGNNSMSQANFIGAFSAGYTSRTEYGSTGSGADTNDWYSFRLTGRTSGTIQISGMTQDLDIEIYNAAGTRIARSANSGMRTDTINLNNLDAGVYYVRVMPGVSGARSAYAMRFGLSVG